MTDDSDKLRRIGAIICRFANGSCLCFEKEKRMCANVVGKAQEVLAIARPADAPAKSAPKKRVK